MTGASWVLFKLENLLNVRVANNWDLPKIVPGQLNSTGWEDSADLSPDGKSLRVAYVAADFHAWMMEHGGNPAFYPRWARGPDRGNQPPFAIDTMESQLVDGRWTAPETMPLSEESFPPWASESGYTTGGGSGWWCSNAPASDTDFDTDIIRDGEPVSFSTPEDENDPCYRAGKLYFWKQAADGTGRKTIWMARDLGRGQFTAPVELPAPINEAGSDSWQPFLASDGSMWFSSDRMGALAVFNAPPTADGGFGTAARIAWPRPDTGVMAVAEPTVSDDNRTLSVCVMFRNPAGEHDLDVVLIPRLN